MIYFPPSIFKIIANNSEVTYTTFDSKKPEAKIYLSTRESEVLELILSGKNTNEIGAALFLSIHTVNNSK
jgi:DNA-binding NarL/FixJ family response regulator